MLFLFGEMISVWPDFASVCHLPGCQWTGGWWRLFCLLLTLPAARLLQLLSRSVILFVFIVPLMFPLFLWSELGAPIFLDFAVRALAVLFCAVCVYLPTHYYWVGSMCCMCLPPYTPLLGKHYVLCVYLHIHYYWGNFLCCVCLPPYTLLLGKLAVLCVFTSQHTTIGETLCAVCVYLPTHYYLEAVCAEAWGSNVDCD